MKHGNIYRQHDGPLPGAGELIEELYGRGRLRIVRIHSEGHTTAPGEWYDQGEDEWVVLLAGTAELHFQDGSILGMGPGDWVLIPAHTPHRVDRTSTVPRALWLAVHLGLPSESEPPADHEHTGLPGLP